MKRSLRIVAMVCLCLTLALAEPSASSAIAIVVGEVSLNGISIVRSSPVLKGDRIRTGRDAAVILHANGVSLHLGPDSEVRYEGQRLELHSGSAQVRGSEEIASGPFVISPAAGAQFQVLRIKPRVLISLTTGTLRVTRRKETAIFGSSGDYQLQDDEPLHPVQRRAAMKGAIAGAGGGAGVIISHWLTGRKGNTSHSPDAPGQPVSNQSPTDD